MYMCRLRVNPMTLLSEPKGALRLTFRAAEGGRSRRPSVCRRACSLWWGNLYLNAGAARSAWLALDGLCLALETIPEVSESQSMRPILKIGVVQHLLLDFVDPEGIDIGL